MIDFQTWQIFYNVFFSGARIDKRVEKIFKMTSGHKYFSVTYMCIWPRAMTKIILKINKSTTILKKNSNCCKFYFGVILKKW